MAGFLEHEELTKFACPLAVNSFYLISWCSLNTKPKVCFIYLIYQASHVIENSRFYRKNLGEGNFFKILATLGICSAFSRHGKCYWLFHCVLTISIFITCSAWTISNDSSIIDHVYSNSIDGTIACNILTLELSGHSSTHNKIT